MSLHTQGDWTVEQVKSRYVLNGESVAYFQVRCTTSTRDKSIALVQPVELHFPVCGDTIFNHEGEADAYLIAAAPKLLAELRDLEGFVSKFGGGPDPEDFMRAAESYLSAARAAIAKSQPPPR